jgi:type I restriction enzyme R subunit
MKQLLLLNWRQKSSARSQLRLTIEDVLDAGICAAVAQTAFLRM